MEEKDLELQLLDMLKNKDLKKLRSVLDTLEPADIAEMMESLYDDDKLKEEDLPRMFRVLPKDLAADTFIEMNPDMQEALIKSFTDKELHQVMDDMFVDDMVDVIEEMPANVVSRMLKAVDNETRRNINTILNYPEDSAGSIMTIEYIDLNANMTVREAFDKIRKEGEDKETINICYVTDNKKLVGLVSIRDLLLNPYEARIGDIMEEDVISVMTTDDREEVANALSKYDYTALPVVDKENRLVGIVTVDDAIDVLTEEATEDIEKMAAITPSEHPYLRSSVFEIWKQRIPWLMLLMISATFTGMIITKFEDALSVQVALTAFIPMLMDTGGNTGSQASVTIIRGISLGDIEFSDIFAVIWKEFRVSILCGLSLAVVGFGKIMLVDRLLMGNTSISVMIALVVSISLVFTIMIAKFVGCTLPLFAKKLGFDPAVMASPFITTIVDALSLLIYMNVAVLLLHIQL
ncbi:MAG: magnesium transporter [Firmicutes bacterium]|nr:magnesium transporter [Bacillota bacterium]